jgi:hypothetical protein
MSNPHFAFLNLEKHEVIAKGHHSPTPCVRIDSKPKRKGAWSVARIEELVKEALIK